MHNGPYLLVLSMIIDSDAARIIDLLTFMRGARTKRVGVMACVGSAISDYETFRRVFTNNSYIVQ